MERTSVERVMIAHEIVCDRCGLRVQRAAEGGDFNRMTSIGFRAEEGSANRGFLSPNSSIAWPMARRWSSFWKPDQSSRGQPCVAGNGTSLPPLTRASTRPWMCGRLGIHTSAEKQKAVPEMALQQSTRRFPEQIE